MAYPRRSTSIPIRMPVATRSRRWSVACAASARAVILWAAILIVLYRGVMAIALNETPAGSNDNGTASTQFPVTLAEAYAYAYGRTVGSTAETKAAQAEQAARAPMRHGNPIGGILPLIFLVVRNRPAEVGSWPDGVPPSAAAGRPGHAIEQQGSRFGECIRTAVFWKLAAATL